MSARRTRRPGFWERRGTEQQATLAEEKRPERGALWLKDEAEPHDGDQHYGQVRHEEPQEVVTLVFIIGLAFLGMAVFTLDCRLSTLVVLATVGVVAGIFFFIVPQQDYDWKRQLRDLALAALAALAFGPGPGYALRTAEPQTVEG